MAEDGVRSERPPEDAEGVSVSTDGDGGVVSDWGAREGVVGEGRMEEAALRKKMNLVLVISNFRSSCNFRSKKKALI